MERPDIITKAFLRSDDRFCGVMKVVARVEAQAFGLMSTDVLNIFKEAAQEILNEERAELQRIERQAEEAFDEVIKQIGKEGKS